MAATHNVSIVKMSFNPQTITIAAGDTVEWTNDMGFAHTATADDGSFDSGEIEGGDTFSHTFDAPGTVPYHCMIHPQMKGTVVANPADTGTKPEGGY